MRREVTSYITFIILFAVIIVTLAGATAATARDFSNTGIMSKGEAELAQGYAPMEPGGSWYDGLLGFWSSFTGCEPPNLFWWLRH